MYISIPTKICISCCLACFTLVNSVAFAAVQSTLPKPKTSMVEELPYEEVTLIATAYYSPLPDQRYYLRGNYEDERVLNGNGTHGASGKAVFEWMLAAPKDYEFGTKIWISGLGTGSVEDRGGAIVNKGVRGHEFDRVDIWMGSGEAGLARALAWGKRTVKARIYKDPQVQVRFDTDTVPQALLSKSVAKDAKEFTKAAAKVSSEKSRKEKQEDELAQKLAYFEKQRQTLDSYFARIDRPKLGTSAPEIRTLQETLRQIGYLNTKSTGIYGPATKAAIAQFQIDKKLVSHEKDPNAGVLGAKTRSVLIEEILYRWVEIES